MKLKMPFVTVNRFIDLHVYYRHAALDGYNFIDAEAKIKKIQMKLPKKEIKTISTCTGLIEMQKRSVCLRSWQDWSIEINDEDINVHTTQKDLFDCDFHTHEQSNGWGEKHGINILKIAPPFAVECEENINWLLSGSPFSHQNFHIPSGLLNFKENASANFFIYLHKGDKKIVKMKLNDHLVNYTPMCDRRVRVHNHFDIPKYEYLIERMISLMQQGEYAKRRLYKKEYEL